MFSQILFEDVFGLNEPPGLHQEDLRTILGQAGFTDISITSKNGLALCSCKKALILGSEPIWVWDPAAPP